MMSQNHAAARDKVQAEHQYEHQEKELALNTRLTEDIHILTQEIRALISQSKNDLSKTPDVDQLLGRQTF